MKYLKKYESPDNVIDEILDVVLTENSGDGIPFVVDNDKVITGEPNTIHAMNKMVEYHMKYPGRLWIKNKLISFWVYPKKNEFWDIIKKLEKNLDIKIINNGWRIEVSYFDGDIIDSDVNVGSIPYYKKLIPTTEEKIIPIEDYTGSDDFPDELRQLHLMNSVDKNKALKDMGAIAKIPNWKKWQKPFESIIMRFETYNIYTNPDPDTINNVPVRDYVGTEYFAVDPEMDEEEPPNATGRNDREVKNKTKKAVYKISVA